MKLRILFLCILALTSCKQDNGKTVGEILGYRWAKSSSACSADYLQFSEARIDYVVGGKSSDPLPIRRIVTRMPEPSTVMFVIQVDRALAAKTRFPNHTTDLAMVFKVEGDRLNLVGHGAPGRILTLTPGDKSYLRHALQRCPA